MAEPQPQTTPPVGKYDEPNLSESQVLPIPKTNKARENGVTVEVCNPQVKDETFNKYVVYTVKGTDNNGEFEVIRRYSDFTRLRTMLVEKWPGCYIPPLPPKALNSLEPKVVRERRRYLQQFCQRIAEINYLHYYEGYQEFLRSKGTSMDKVFQPFMKKDYEEIINRYATTFGQLSGREYNLHVVKKITDFKTFLKKVQGQVVKMKKQAKKMSKAKQNFYQEFAFMNGLVCMEYEKTVFSQYHQEDDSKNVFYDAKSAELYGYAEKVEEGSKKASLEYLEEWMRSEAREIEAFLDALNQKDHYDNLMTKTQGKQKSESAELQKSLAGKTTLTTVRAVIFRKNKAEELGNLEKQIEKHGKDYEDLTKLNDMITLILAYEEIDKFKLNKEKSYHSCVRAAANNELKALTNMESYWKAILSNKNVAGIPE